MTDPTALADREQETCMTEFPPGEYAIVELFGHTTLVGRISEVERFGAKMMALEPLFRSVLLPAVLHGGAAIYRMTPCTAEQAFSKQPKHDRQLPVSIRCILPAAMLEAPGDVVDAETSEEDGGDGIPF